jgi:hypothetical protein
VNDRDERAARLAQQLRANLKRRKAQARASADPSPDDAPGGEEAVSDPSRNRPA